jgi:rare lipoprotein A
MAARMKIGVTLLLIPMMVSGKTHAAKKKSGSETGLAVYYANKFAGRRTSSGEKYDPAKFTAAHRRLPFGTCVKVTRLDNGKSVVVKINDRGPFGDKRRIIDLSYAAAKKIGMIRAGKVKVRIEIVDK